jgi:guanylate kinase
VGKTTLIRSVLSRRPHLKFSVSCTTRAPREGEIPGQDYHFLSREEFLEGVRRGRFLEWAEVHGAFYGTDGKRIQEWLENGEDVLLDIDVQGARQVRCLAPSALTLFILPPSLEILAGRLERRGTETSEQLAKRLSTAKQELQEAPWYDFIIVNDDLETAAADFEAVLRAARCQRAIQAPRLHSFLKARS